MIVKTFKQKVYEYKQVTEAEVSALMKRLKSVTTCEEKLTIDDQNKLIREILPLVLLNKEQIERLQVIQTKIDEKLNFLLTENTRFRERIRRLEEYFSLLVLEKTCVTK